MPTPDIEISETIDLPLEAFQEYLKEKSFKKAKLKSQFWLSVLGILVALVTGVVLPLLVPALLTGMVITGCIFLALGAVCCSIFPIHIRDRLSKEKYEALVFKPHTIEVALDSFTTKTVLNPLKKVFSYTLSKTKINNKEYTVFTVKKSRSTLKSQTISSLQHEIVTMLNAMTNHATLKIGRLAQQKKELTQKIKLVSDKRENKALIEKLTIELSTLETKIQTWEGVFTQIKEANERLTAKHTLEEIYRNPIVTLFESLEIYKKNLTLFKTISKNLARSEQAKQSTIPVKYISEIRSYFTARCILKENIEKVKTELNTCPIQSIAQERKEILDLASQTLLQEDLEFALQCFPEEATKELAKRLDDRTTHESTLQELKELITQNPLPDNSVNQQIHWILANHFYRQFLKDKTSYVSERACRYALSLDSQNELNATEKESIILAAFYFDAPLQPDALPAEAQDVLLSSHANPQAYEALKSIMRNQDVTTKPVMLSQSEPKTKSEISDKELKNKDNSNKFNL